MYFSATTKMHSEDAKMLTAHLEVHRNSDVLVVCASTSSRGEFAWTCRQGLRCLRGCGKLSALPCAGIAVAAHDSKIFMGDRTPYLNLIERLPEPLRQGWTRVTFDKDCRAAGAFGLHEEQAWCEAAFGHDGSPAEPTAYITHVIGSKNYFGYFNIYWEENDVFSIKSCHDLRTWATVYIPRFYGERDVARWVFLSSEDYKAFLRMAGDYSRIFSVMDFPFDVFHAAGGSAVRKPVAGNAGIAGALRTSLQAVLSSFGLNVAQAWTPSDQAAVNRLVEILARGPDEAIDQSKAPLRLPKLKSLLLKRLSFAEVPAGAPTRDETLALYLDLSRFYPNWDKVSLRSLFETRGREITVDSFIESVNSDAAHVAIQKSRLQLLAELNSQGINVDNLH